MMRPPRLLLVLAALVFCPAASLSDRRLLLPSFPPLITASCPQFPALNGPGVLCEDFDTNRNGVAGFQFTRLPIGVDPNDPLRALGDPNDDVLGYTQGSGPSPTGTGGRRCSDDRGLGRLGCEAPVAEENDWHLHSTFEAPDPGYDPRPGHSAPDGGKAHSGVRSMHWGRHVEGTTHGDTLRYRQISAFVLDPAVNLGPSSMLEFWQIISVPDDEGGTDGFLPWGGAFGGGQAQISLLGANGRFEKWTTLLPSFNGYDSIINRTISICQFDAGDDQVPPNDDSLCAVGSPVWADMGDVNGTDATCSTDTDGNDPLHKDCGAISSCTGGPGCTENGALGAGVWARSAFDLSPFAGRMARLRWIASMGGGWSFGIDRSSIESEYGSYYYFDSDDGWYLDDIHLTDLRQAPLPCSADSDMDGVALCDDCNDIDDTAQAAPSEVLDLSFAADGRTLSWSPPTSPGGSVLFYDTLASTRSTFIDAGRCVEGDEGQDQVAVDTAVPPPGMALYYLVRAQNGCPGGAGSAGTTSAGYGRTTRTCSQ